MGGVLLSRSSQTLNPKPLNPGGFYFLDPPRILGALRPSTSGSDTPTQDSQEGDARRPYPDPQGGCRK